MFKARTAAVATGTTWLYSITLEYVYVKKRRVKGVKDAELMKMKNYSGRKKNPG